jgi:hypothetical protein
MTMADTSDRAAEFENWLDQLDPATTPAEDIADLRAVAEAVSDRDAAEQQVRAAVDAARANGRSWARIGIALGVSRQAAHERYGMASDTDDIPSHQPRRRGRVARR